jgi:hypothetical protein
MEAQDEAEGLKDQTLIPEPNQLPGIKSSSIAPGLNTLPGFGLPIPQPQAHQNVAPPPPTAVVPPPIDPSKLKDIFGGVDLEKLKDMFGGAFPPPPPNGMAFPIPGFPPLPPGIPGIQVPPPLNVTNGGIGNGTYTANDSELNGSFKRPASGAAIDDPRRKQPRQR